MFKRIKELEQRVKALEELVQQLAQQKKEENDFLNPPVMGGRRSE